MGRRRRVEIDGVTYESMRVAARVLGTCHSAISFRLDPDAVRASDRKYHRENRDAMRPKRRVYSGLPEPTRDCPANCEICGTPFINFARSPALDHDHLTGEFRGWLCTNCNTGLGLFRDSPLNLRRALAYLGSL